jgi:plastocyanin
MRMNEPRRSRWLIAVLPIVLVAVLAACGSSGNSSTSSGTTPAATTGAGGGASKVTIANFAFSPSTITVPVGTTVTWTNNDTVAHNIISTNGPSVNASETSTFTSALLDQGKSFSFKFTKAGTFYYECSIHKAMASMHAKVVVK